MIEQIMDWLTPIAFYYGFYLLMLFGTWAETREVQFTYEEDST